MGVYHTILVGTDGSASSFQAVDRAASCACAHEAKLVIVCAYRSATEKELAFAEEELGDSAFEVAGSNPAERILREASGRAAQEGCSRTETLAVEGEPAGVLLSETGRWAADLIVVGDRGLGAVADRIIGSVPGNVVRKAKVDALVVHTATE